MMSVTTFTDLRRPAQRLVEEMAADPYGLTSPSIYETARLVVSAPWLDGHRERVEFLLAQQHEDGTWGAPDAYWVLPTLSAVDALLSVLGTDGAGADGAGPVAGAARSGLAALAGRFPREAQLPDTIAVELLAPWLVEQIDQRLAGAGARRPPDAAGMPGRLELPVDTEVLSQVRELLRAHSGIPEKTWHSLEALGATAVRSPAVLPVSGAVGASPAATAAWLGDPPHGDAARESLDYLHRTQARHGGPVSGITSITYFERAWVVAALRAAGLHAQLPIEVTDSLRAALGATGLSAGPGLPADSDDTAAALHALDLAGKPEPADCLWGYDTGLYFQCFTGERTPSVSTNAHILTVLAEPSRLTGPRYRAAAERVAGWLIEQQRPDGSWIDKWHASPYYATACCAAALARLGGPRASAALDGAVRWVLDAQRADGSWGRWAGTGEETAYAVQTLNHGAASDRPAVDAILRGRAFLTAHIENDGDDPPLWHDKDLYAPIRVIRAEILAAVTATGEPAALGERATP